VLFAEGRGLPIAVVPVSGGIQCDLAMSHPATGWGGGSESGARVAFSGRSLISPVRTARDQPYRQVPDTANGTV